MEFLHIADTGTHLGGLSLVGILVAPAGILAGAFFVFGLPAIPERRRATTGDDGPAGIANEDDAHRY